MPAEAPCIHCNVAVRGAWPLDAPWPRGTRWVAATHLVPSSLTDVLLHIHASLHCPCGHAERATHVVMAAHVQSAASVTHALAYSMHASFMEVVSECPGDATCTSATSNKATMGMVMTHTLPHTHSHFAAATCLDRWSSVDMSTS